MVDKSYRNQAIEWLNSRKRDFRSGLNILSDAGYKPGVIRVLAKHGENGPSAMERLNYHMISYANSQQEQNDEDPELHVFDGHESKVVEKPNSILQAIKKDDSGEYVFDGNIKKLLKTYAMYYNQRCREENKLANLPEDNTEDIVKERKIIIENIDICTDILERLYPLWKRYSTDGTVPTEEEILKADVGDGCEECEDEEEEQSEDEYAKLSKEELQKVRKSIATKITRAQNMLDYQTEAKGEVLNPMLDPIKITKYKAKIEKLTIELNKVKMAIAKFG